jgi:hypothetical protein
MPARPSADRVPRELHGASRFEHGAAYSMGSRSMSVPPFKRMVAKQQEQPAFQAGHTTPQLCTPRTLSFLDVSLNEDGSGLMQSLPVHVESPGPTTVTAVSFFDASFIGDSRVPRPFRFAFP